MISKVQNPDTAAPLFAGWNETLIWSCLQQVMGGLYADSPEHPQSAAALLGDFAFYAGKPDEELVRYKPEGLTQDFIIMVPQNDAWAKCIETCYPGKAKKVSRYAIKKEPAVFDKEKLKKIAAALPSGCILKQIDKSLYYRCRETDWCKDLVSQYPDYQTWERLGLGFVLLKDNEIVSGASSYSTYSEGIEIEIDTHTEHRRKGFALICGARLILECLAKNLYPSWDAQNIGSVALSEKLGYHYSHTYTAYEIWGY